MLTDAFEVGLSGAALYLEFEKEREGSSRSVVGFKYYC